MDLEKKRVTRDQTPIHLGPTEFRLLEHFLRNQGRVYSRDQLLDSVWGGDVYRFAVAVGGRDPRAQERGHDGRERCTSSAQLEHAQPGPALRRRRSGGAMVS